MHYVFSRLIAQRQKRFRLFYHLILSIVYVLFACLFVTFSYVLIFTSFFSNLYFLVLMLVVILAFSLVLMYFPHKLRLNYENKLVNAFFAYGKTENLTVVPQELNETRELIFNRMSNANIHLDKVSHLYSFKLVDQVFYVVISIFENNKTTLLYVPTSEVDSYYALIHSSFAAPLLFKNEEIKRIPFVSEVNAYYYATRQTTNDKIYLRKVLERHYLYFLSKHHEKLGYTITPESSFLLLNNLPVIAPLRLLHKYNVDDINEQMKTLLIIQEIIEKMVEKRELWVKKSLQ